MNTALPKVIMLSKMLNFNKLTSNQFDALLNYIEMLNGPLTLGIGSEFSFGSEERLMRLMHLLSQKEVQHLYILGSDLHTLRNLPEILAAIGNMRQLQTLMIGHTQLFSHSMGNKEVFDLNRWNAFLKALKNLKMLSAFSLDEDCVLRFLTKSKLKELFDILQANQNLKIISFVGIHNHNTQNLIIELLTHHNRICQTEGCRPRMLPDPEPILEDEDGDPYIDINAVRKQAGLNEIDFRDCHKTDIRLPLDTAPNRIIINEEMIIRCLIEEKEEEQISSGDAPSSKCNSPVSSTSSTSSILSDSKSEASHTFIEVKIPELELNKRRADIK